MLEIIAIIFLCTKMGKILRKKGWQPTWMQVFVVAGWVGSMLIAAIGYGLYLTITRGPDAAEDMGFAAYPWMLLAAVLMQATLFTIAHFLPDRTKEPVPGFHVDPTRPA